MEIREIISNSKVNLTDLISQSQDIQSKCSDYNITKANSENMYYQPDSLKFLYKPDTEELRTVGATRHALSQLCNKIGVPIRYIEKCIDSGRLDLATDNINSWIEDFNKNLFIREYDGNMRGVLSDRYSVLDTPDILDVLSGTSDISEYNVKGYYLTPERFHARLIQREPMNIEGEDLFAGLQIDSSDVGRSVLTVQFFIFKQVCTNGLVISKGGGMLFQQKHIGIVKDEFYKGFSDSIHNIPVIVNNAKAFIENARKDSDRYKKAFIDQKEMEHLVNSLKVTTKLSDEGVAKVIDTMRSTYSTSRWGLVNALTQVAQDYTLERRLELEAMAGNMLLVA